MQGILSKSMIAWNSNPMSVPNFLAESAEKVRPFGIDMSIESLSSQEFSVSIFIFLMIAVAIFAGIIFLYMFKDTANRLKTGEKWLFAWLFIGVVVAVAFGAAQMVNGYLF